MSFGEIIPEGKNMRGRASVYGSFERKVNLKEVWRDRADGNSRRYIRFQTTCHAEVTDWLLTGASRPHGATSTAFLPARPNGGSQKEGMTKALAAFIIGGAFVAVAMLLGHHNVATPIPFVVLSPGIMAGALAPDSGFSPEGDLHPWGFFSTSIVFVVDIAIYGGLVYLLLHLAGRFGKVSK